MATTTTTIYTVEAEGSGHLIIRRGGEVIREVMAGPAADAWLDDHGLTWDDIDSGSPVEFHAGC